MDKKAKTRSKNRRENSRTNIAQQWYFTCCFERFEQRRVGKDNRMLDDFEVLCEGTEVYFECGRQFYKQYFRENGIFTMLEYKFADMGYKMFTA